MKGWKFDIRSAIGGFIIGMLLMFIAGTLRPPV